MSLLQQTVYLQCSQMFVPVHAARLQKSLHLTDTAAPDSRTLLLPDVCSSACCRVQKSLHLADSAAPLSQAICCLMVVEASRLPSSRGWHHEDGPPCHMSRGRTGTTALATMAINVTQVHCALECFDSKASLLSGELASYEDGSGGVQLLRLGL